MATIKIILYKQKTLKDGKHPVMLQITNNEKSSRISIGFRCFKNEWDVNRCRFKKQMENARNKNTILRDLETRAEQILDKIRKEKLTYTPKLFKDLFVGVKKEITVKDFYEIILDELEAKNKLGNRGNYKTSMNSLIKFTKGRTFYFEDITYNFLKKYEAFLIQRGCSGGGVHNYMRTLRAAINEAIRRDYLNQENYPFSTQFNKKGYSLSHLKSNASPRALSISDMDKLKNFNVDAYPELKESWLFFMFSYYARGMNFIDMAYLKWEDVYNNKISYRRHKTNKQFNIPISEHLQKILDEFEPRIFEYVFPVFSNFHKTAVQQNNRTKKIRKKYNGDLKEIGKILELPNKLTSYVARHTYATTLKAKNVSVAKISQSMGHADITTTEAYLKQFEDAEIDKLDELL